ncbi:uncharacterized protein F5891DRAFT_935397, partial [Suillus fuscotomentosus]
LAAAFSAAAVAVATLWSLPYINKIPQHNSILIGQGWVRELLSGHPHRFHNMMGLSKPVFRQLLHELSEYAVFSGSLVSDERECSIFL